MALLSFYEYDTSILDGVMSKKSDISTALSMGLEPIPLLVDLENLIKNYL